MSDFWLKLKFWTKLILTAAVTLFFLIFLSLNSNRPVTIWLWNEHPTTLLRLIFYVFLAGIVVTFLSQTTVKTFYQFRTLRARSATARAEQQLADMKSKAAMLQTRPVASSTPPPTSPLS
jgi:hypothetical protein